MSDDKNLAEAVRKWRGQFISTVLLLEKYIDIYIAKHFCSGKKVWELLELIISTNRITFENKLQVFKCLLERHDNALSSKHKTIFTDIVKIIETRNVFAHYMMYSGNEAVSKFKKNGTVTFVKFKNDTSFPEFTPEQIVKLLEKSTEYTTILKEHNGNVTEIASPSQAFGRAQLPKSIIEEETTLNSVIIIHSLA